MLGFSKVVKWLVLGRPAHLRLKRYDRASTQAPEVKLRSGSADDIDVDVCRHNWIHHNTFRTYGNECVDVKEGSTDNLIEHNICEQQKDSNSGGFGLRGSENTLRYNEIAECVGSGVRMGGDKGYGGGNNVYGNKIRNTGKGGFYVMQTDQGVVCENEVSGTTLVSCLLNKA